MFETWLRIVFGLSTKCAGDPRVVTALRDQLEHLALAVGELGKGHRGELGRGVVKKSMTRRATSGPKIASPLPTARIARAMSPAPAPLSM